MTSTSGWLFTRGPHCIRIVREETPAGGRIVVYGPGPEVTSQEFPDMTGVARAQADFELRLLARGYHLAQRPVERRIEAARSSPPRTSSNAPPVCRVQIQPLSAALFWSKRGEVACRVHAPLAEPERWQAEGWCAIPNSGTRRGLAYQCPRCAPDGRIHRRARKTGVKKAGVGRQPDGLSSHASETRPR